MELLTITNARNVAHVAKNCKSDNIRKEAHTDMEKNEIFTAKKIDEAKEMAANAFDVLISDIDFEIIEQPKKGLFGAKGDFRVRAIYTPKQTSANSGISVTSQTSQSAKLPSKLKATPITDPDVLSKFAPTIGYIKKILDEITTKSYEVTVKKSGDNNVIDITGDSLGMVIGRRGETLDALQYLAILANNRIGEENERLRIVVDCNGYREKRTETLEALAARTAAKVKFKGRRITLEPMNPYERRVIHSKVSELEGVYSNSIGEEPYRKVVISAELPKKRATSVGGSGGRTADGKNGNNRDNRDRNRRDYGHSTRNDNDVIPQRIPGEVSNAVHSRSYKKSTGFSTSFEREYQRSLTEEKSQNLPEGQVSEFSQDTIDAEKSATLYGKIEL